MPHFSIPDKTEINCCTGLAWMKNASSDPPKTRKMKTTREHRNLEETKRHFRELFDAQHKLELNGDRSNPKVQTTILMMDQMLQELLDSLSDFE